MGEAHEYMEMMVDMEEAARLAADLEDMETANAKAAEIDRLMKLPANEWQPGCPFKLKDIVYHSDLKECKVVGLPTVNDVANDVE